MKVGDRVIVSRAIAFQGGSSSLAGATGRLAWLSRSGRAATIVVDGELDELWVFTREFDILEPVS